MPFNFGFASHPGNWIVVGIMGAFWLLAFHVVMQGFTTMQGNRASV